MALRMLPSLSLTVMEDSVRKRKRVVMFVPGLVAFGVYRLTKSVLPLEDPFTLLTVSGLVAAAAAVSAYGVGRCASWSEIIRNDGRRMLSWVTGWVGAVYGVQLSLLVLSLLWLMDYNYLQHPDGPALMAVIICCTAAARDAFEIGHVRKILLLGRPFFTFPDGEQFRAMLQNRAAQVGPWAVVGLVAGAMAAMSGLAFTNEHDTALAQLLGVTIVGGALSLCAYFDGLHPPGSWVQALRRTAPAELLKYWWWPGMAFSSTYYLVAMGVLLFIARQPRISTVSAALVGALVSAMMALYGYYLGHRRQVEDEQAPQLSEGMVRCPFVMGILGKAVGARDGGAGEVALGKTGSKG
jgi:hypothetical protein